tara:strand:- start:871 stop:1362 length:492 start_codon:yes stop_codon:yes gene_type:complete
MKDNIIRFLLVIPFIILLALFEYIFPIISFAFSYIYIYEPLLTPTQIYNLLLTIFDDFSILYRLKAFIFFIQHYIMSSIVLPMFAACYVINYFKPRTISSPYFLAPIILFILLWFVLIGYIIVENWEDIVFSPSYGTIRFWGYFLTLFGFVYYDKSTSKNLKE